MIMGADALKNNLGNPARSYLFSVTIPNPRGSGDSTTMQLRCRAASIPERSVETFNVPFMQTAGVQYAGPLKYSHTWDLSFFEGEDRASFDAFYSWAQLIVDDYAGTGVDDPSYKTNITLQLLTRSDGLPYNTIQLVGCFPITAKAIALKWGGKDMYEVAATMSFDRFETQNS